MAPLETLHFARIEVELGICHFQNLWGNLQIDPEVSHCSTRKLLGSSGYDHHQPGAVLGVNRNTFGSGKSYKNPQLGGAVAQLCVVIFHHRYRLYIEAPISQVVTSWLVVWKIFSFSIQLGMSSSQLTNSYFSEGWLNHQPAMEFKITIPNGFITR